MKSRPSLRRLLLASATLAVVNSTQAATLYWDGTSSSWNTNTNWSTDSGATTPDPTTVPGAADDAIFNISTVDGAQTITLDANQAINSMTFENTGTTALTGGGTDRTLSLGAGGITMATGAGAVTLGSGAAGNNVLINLAGAQTWTNNTANAFTINNTAATFTRQTGATLLFNKASTGNFAVNSGVSNTNGIIGPWAFFGTGDNQRYATISSGNVTGLTGTTATTVNGMTSATANYVYTATGTTFAGSTTLTANTIRTALANTISLSVSSGAAYNLTVNGILATAASGTFTISKSTSTDPTRGVQIGSTGELVIAGQQAVTISAPIHGVDRGVTYSGSNLLTLSGVNTYSGATTMSSGILRLNNALALQNSPLNTTGSIAGDSSNGLRTTLTALTIGGLAGDKDFASLFTTTSGGYSSVANLTLNPGTGASHSYSGVIANGAADMNLIKTGAGTQTLSGANTYTGTTTISQGALILDNATALGGNNPGVNGTSSISMAAGTTLRSNYIIADAGNVDSFVYAPITLTGTGSVNFLIGAGSSAAPAEAVTFNLNGAIGGTEGTNVVFSSSGDTNNPDSTFVLNAASTYDGNTTITVGGTNERINVKAGVVNALPTTTVLTFGNIDGSGSGRINQYDLNGNNQTLAGLDNGGTVPSLRNDRVTNSSETQATLTINNADDFIFGGATTSGSTTTRGQITGNLALTKNGSGTFTLSGLNTYTGATTVSDGVLMVNGSTAAGSAVTIEADGTLGGNGTVNGSLALTGNLAPGQAGASIQTLNAGATTWNSGSVWKFDLSSTDNSSDKLAIAGVFTGGLGDVSDGYVFDFMGSQPKWGEVYTLAEFTSFSGFTADIEGLTANFKATNLGEGSYSTSFFTLNGNSLTFTAIPEPGTALAGLLLTAGLLRRRRRD